MNRYSPFSNQPSRDDFILNSTIEEAVEEGYIHVRERTPFTSLNVSQLQYDLISMSLRHENQYSPPKKRLPVVDLYMK